MRDAARADCARRTLERNARKLGCAAGVGWMLAAALGLAVCGCAGEMVEQDDTLGHAPDAAPTGGSTAAAADALADDSAAACDPRAGSIGDGWHLPGEPCLACHRVGGTASPMSLAGTLYSDRDGSSTVAGATIRLLDANGNSTELVTTDNGNFWARDPIAFPIRITASLCPDSPEMPSPVAATGAECNQGGCHGEAGARIHLP